MTVETEANGESKSTSTNERGLPWRFVGLFMPVQEIFLCTGELYPKKIYRLKEDQAFSLSLELDRREKFARHPSADILLHSLGGGGDFVDTRYCYCFLKG